MNLGSVLATVQFRGANIAGFDFGCSTDGTCITTEAYGALTELDGPDGAGQMVHFTNTHGFNLYRLPVGWQYLVNNVLGGPLDTKSSANYDVLVQACLATGSHCLIDIHNYARWNGAIIGQGGPTNDQFASLWSQLATKYASESKIVFGLMNEPHDLPDINLWAASVQAAVTAIRTAGAISQIILLPGNDYTSAESFVSGGSAEALCAVTNLEGSKTNLIFDVHKYFDSDGSGTSADCVSNQIDASFSPLATYLRANNRQALLSETGGGSFNSDCLLAVCQALSYLDANSDVYLGYTGWGAGSFAPSYVLSMTPFGSAATGWTDQELVSQCFASVAGGSNSTSTAPPSIAAATTTADTASISSTSLTSFISMTTAFSYSFTAAALSYTDSTVSTTSTSFVTTTTVFPYSFSAAAISYTDAPVSTSFLSTTTAFSYSFTAAAHSYTDSTVSTTSTSFASTTTVFAYSFSAAAISYTDAPVSTTSTSFLSTTTTFAYSFTAAALTYTDTPGSTSCTCTPTPTYGPNALSTLSPPTTISTSTTFEYSYIPAPTTISTPASAQPYGVASSTMPSTGPTSLSTVSFTTEMYSFAAAPTGGPPQVSFAVISFAASTTSSGFTTVVRPSSTEEAGSEGTGGGDTCVA
ncbi:hypothetical protein MMC34_006501 [Xylographa carneopallida]|nr:hypothetical protein [Xylographa carneopallida]